MSDLDATLIWTLVVGSLIAGALGGLLMFVAIRLLRRLFGPTAVCTCNGGRGEHPHSSPYGCEATGCPYPTDPPEVS